MKAKTIYTEYTNSMIVFSNFNGKFFRKGNQEITAIDGHFTGFQCSGKEVKMLYFRNVDDVIRFLNK